MSAATAPGTSDPRLSAFLCAETENDAARALDELLSGDLTQLIQDTVRRTLCRSPWALTHLDDVVGDVQLKLVKKLRLLRSGAGEAIENMAAYATTSADHACYAFLRRRFPERTRLRNRLRYALTHHPSTALAPDASGVWRCHAVGVRRAPAAGSTQSLLDAPAQFVADRRIESSGPISTLAHALLAACDAPVEFDRFVEALSIITGVSDVQPEAQGGARQYEEGGDEGTPLDQIADPSPAADLVLEHKGLLRHVWDELVALPVRQRAALLLNLRDPSGGSMLQMLPATSVVTTLDIARALEITEAQLAALWEELPLDDLSIAGRLGLTRQQVINLRKSGRSRLARRWSVISVSISHQSREKDSL